MAGDTGVWLGSRLQSFNIWEGHPDVIEPGKRPRITLSPTIVLDGNGRPEIAISVAGGDNQDQMTLQLLLNLIDFGLEPAEAVRAPRFMTDHFISSFGQTPPPALGQLRINPELGSETLEALKKLGHKLVVRPGSLAAAPCVIAIDAEARMTASATRPPETLAPGGTRWRYPDTPRPASEPLVSVRGAARIEDCRFKAYSIWNSDLRSRICAGCPAQSISTIESCRWYSVTSSESGGRTWKIAIMVWRAARRWSCGSVRPARGRWPGHRRTARRRPGPRRAGT